MIPYKPNCDWQFPYSYLLEIYTELNDNNHSIFKLKWESYKKRFLNPDNFTEKISQDFERNFKRPLYCDIVHNPKKSLFGFEIYCALTQWNTFYPLDEYKYEINQMKKMGFNVIGIAQMYFETCLVFETENEAHLAYKANNNLKKDGLDCDFYGLDEFKMSVRDYEKHADSKVLIHWLNNK